MSMKSRILAALRMERQRERFKVNVRAQLLMRPQTPVAVPATNVVIRYQQAQDMPPDYRQQAMPGLPNAGQLEQLRQRGALFEALSGGRGHIVHAEGQFMSFTSTWRYLGVWSTRNLALSAISHDYNIRLRARAAAQEATRGWA